MTVICPNCGKPATLAYYNKDYTYSACDACVTPEKMKTCDVCGQPTLTCYYDNKGNKLGCRSCMKIHFADARDDFQVQTDGD